MILNMYSLIHSIRDGALKQTVRLSVLLMNVENFSFILEEAVSLIGLQISEALISIYVCPSECNDVVVARTDLKSSKTGKRESHS